MLALRKENAPHKESDSSPRKTKLRDGRLEINDLGNENPSVNDPKEPTRVSQEANPGMSDPRAILIGRERSRL